jgi:hypothetical protein
LSNDLYAVVFAPSTSLTNERLFHLAGVFKRLSDTNLPEMPEDIEITGQYPW